MKIFAALIKDKKHSLNLGKPPELVRLSYSGLVSWHMTKCSKFSRLSQLYTQLVFDIFWTWIPAWQKSKQGGSRNFLDIEYWVMLFKKVFVYVMIKGLFKIGILYTLQYRNGHFEYEWKAIQFLV